MYEYIYICICIYDVLFFIYIEMSKDLSAKYYQENNERLPEKARERNQNLSKEEKEKN